MSSIAPTLTPHNIKGAQRNSIDNEIKELEERIQALRTQRNELAPAASLPSELLIRIFRFTDSHGTKAYTWTAVTHVCHYWRDVALGTNTLWRDITYANTDEIVTSRSWALAAFQRSGQCELDVQIAQINPHSEDLAFVYLVLAELHRIRNLVVAFSADEPSSELEHLTFFLQRPAPILETFHIICGFFTPNEEGNLPRPGFSRDITWFDGVSPRLQSMIVHFPPCNLNGLPGQNLINLEIILPNRASASCRITFPALIDLLSETQRFLMLNLDHAYFLDDEAPVRLQHGRIFLGSLVLSKLTPGEERLDYHRFPSVL